MVSNASEDLPEPLRPVITTSRSRGISISTFLRLCSRAPFMTILSAMDLRRGAPSTTRCRRPRRVIDRRDHAAWIRPVATRDVECGSVVRRGPDEGQAERDVHRAIKLQSLQRNQALIMI